MSHCKPSRINELPELHVLTPSFRRAFARVFLSTAGIAGMAAVFERYSSGHWWSADYFESFAIPLLLMPALVCLMFVPRVIHWSETEFRIQPRFARQRTLPWTQLYAYGSGNQVFLLQFTGVSTFQIFTGAFDSAQWSIFRAFLAAKHADKKASLWLGPIAFRRD